MFDTLTERLDGVFSKLRKRGKLHPKQVDNALADVRTALLEADVAVEVVDDLLNRVRSRALSEEVLKSLTPAQQVVKVMNDELTVTLGGEHRPFTLPGASPVVVLLAGVQGSGKTTASAKRAKYLKSKGRRPLLVGADLDRPAAVEQLRTLGREIGVPVWSEGRDPVKLAKNGGRRRHRRRGRAPARGPGDDEAGEEDQGRHQAGSRVDGVRRDDGAGCGDPGTRVHARRRHDGVHPDQARRGCSWRRRLIDDRGDGSADLLRGNGGAAG